MRITGTNLGVRLAGRVVFESVAFDWRSPGTVAVTGPNGSGKTTLLKVLAGLLVPGRGSVAWEEGGRSLARRQARGHVGFAGPEIGLYEDLTAVENLGFFAMARGLAWDPKRAKALLDRVGLDDRGGDRVASYSSGMKQRLKLAFAVLTGAGLLLLDEPGMNLDEEGRARLSALVEEEARKALVIVATNDRAEAEWGRDTLTLPFASQAA